MANAPEVIIIPARKKIGNRVVKENEKKIHVAAYCRVSTDLTNRKKATMPRLSTLKRNYRRIRHGCRLGFMPTMGSAPQTPRSVISSIR